MDDGDVGDDDACYAPVAALRLPEGCGLTPGSGDGAHPRGTSRPVVDTTESAGFLPPSSDSHGTSAAPMVSVPFRDEWDLRMLI